MKTPCWTLVLIFLALASPLPAGQLVWTPGGEGPLLDLSLGDGVVKRTLELPSGAATLTLVLRAFLLDDSRLVVTWKSGKDLWLRQYKKIPGDQATQRVTLPPGREIALEITTVSGTPVAAIKLRRN